MRALLATAILLGACGTFEEPSIVLDLRILGMRTDVGFDSPTKADQVIDVEDENLIGVLAQLQTTDVTAWVADPGKSRQLFWSMQLCLLDDEGRCDLSLPHLPFGAGIIEDPDAPPVDSEGRPAQSRPIPFAQIIPSSPEHGREILAMLTTETRRNPVTALGGVDLNIELRIGGVDEPRENDIVGMKKLRISPRFPPQRAPNSNPEFLSIETATASLGIGLGNVPRSGIFCANTLEDPPSLNAGDSVTLFPNEADGTRENYITPGLDGSAILIEESVSYQWLSTYGSWSDETTGGGHDILGNQSLLGSDWTAPRNLPDGTLVSLWMIQRDERLGVTLWEMCIRVDQ